MLVDINYICNQWRDTVKFYNELKENTEFRSQHSHLKSREFFPFLILVELWISASSGQFMPFS